MEVEKSESDLAEEQAAETQALLQLVALVQEEHRVLHSHLHQQHSNDTARLARNERTVQTMLETGKEGCDEARASVIKAKAKLDLTGTALKACLTAKKEIKEKIDQVLLLEQKVAACLQKCLATKEELREKIKYCHERRDLAREKL